MNETERSEEDYGPLYGIKFIKLSRDRNREWHSETYWDRYESVVEHLITCGFEDLTEGKFVKRMDDSRIYAVITTLQEER